jgi:hypothetical protein
MFPVPREVAGRSISIRPKKTVAGACKRFIFLIIIYINYNYIEPARA